MHSYDKVVLKYYSRLSARGSKSPTISSGAGSGGSITILSNFISHTGGWLDVSGGDADTFSGAGGGGRIAVLVSALLSLLPF